MTIIHILVVYLTGTGRQQVLEGPKTMFDPVATLPRPDEPGPLMAVARHIT